MNELNEDTVTSSELCKRVGVLNSDCWEKARSLRKLKADLNLDIRNSLDHYETRQAQRMALPEDLAIIRETWPYLQRRITRDARLLFQEFCNLDVNGRTSFRSWNSGFAWDYQDLQVEFSDLVLMFRNAVEEGKGEWNEFDRGAHSGRLNWISSKEAELIIPIMEKYICGVLCRQDENHESKSCQSWTRAIRDFLSQISSDHIPNQNLLPNILNCHHC